MPKRPRGQSRLAEKPAAAPNAVQEYNSQVLADAVRSGVPQFYLNGFVSGMSTGDVIIALQQNGAPIAVLNMSYTVAKTLGVALGQIIASIEQMSEREMLTQNELDELIRKSGKPRIPLKQTLSGRKETP